MGRNILIVKSFSLLELMIVLSIFGILFASLTPVVHKINETVKNVKIQNDLSSIGVASQNYYLYKGNWPNQVNDLVPDFISQNILENIIISNRSNVLIITLDNKTIMCPKPPNTS